MNPRNLLDVPCAEEHAVHTRYRIHRACFLSTHEIHNIPLRGVGVSILELEYLVDSIFFESGKLDKETQRSGQIFADDDVLLASDLVDLSVSLEWGELRVGIFLTHAFKKSQQIFPRLVPDVVSFFVDVVRHQPASMPVGLSRLTEAGHLQTETYPDLPSRAKTWGERSGTLIQQCPVSRARKDGFSG